MRDKLHISASGRRWLVSLMVIVVILVCVVIVICAKDAFYLGYDATVTSVNEGWSSEAGEI